MKDISGSRFIEREFVLAHLGDGGAVRAVLDIGPGWKPKLCVEALRRGFELVVAVDMVPIKEDWMAYTLKGDRKFEWGWVKDKLPQAEGGETPPLRDGTLLDIGPAPGDPKPARIASDRGWMVTAVGLEEPYQRLPEQRFVFVQGDFNEVDFEALGLGPFDWILCVSTIEHFGIPGRYGIEVMDDDADLRGMAKMKTLLKPQGRVLLTVPLGKDAVFVPKHRVYGPERLPRLLGGWQVWDAKYYAKFDGDDTYRACTRGTAYAAVPTVEPSYYALGCFVLGVSP